MPTFSIHLLSRKAVYAEFERRASGATGSTNLNIDLARGGAPLAPLHVQQKIAGILDKADAHGAQSAPPWPNSILSTNHVFLEISGPR